MQTVVVPVPVPSRRVNTEEGEEPWVPLQVDGEPLAKLWAAAGAGESAEVATHVPLHALPINLDDFEPLMGVISGSGDASDSSDSESEEEGAVGGAGVQAILDKLKTVEPVAGVTFGPIESDGEREKAAVEADVQMVLNKGRSQAGKGVEGSAE